MKALSIKEPYISEIISGEKTMEYRSWPTKHRGDLLLCGSASPKGDYAGVAACVVEITGRSSSATARSAGSWRMSGPSSSPLL